MILTVILTIIILLYAQCYRYTGLIAALLVAYAVVFFLWWLLVKLNQFLWWLLVKLNQFWCLHHPLFRFKNMLHGILCHLFWLTAGWAPFWSWLDYYILGHQDLHKCSLSTTDLLPYNSFAFRGLHTSAYRSIPDMTPHPYVEQPQYPLTNEMQSMLNSIRVAWGSFYNSRMELVVGIMLGDGTIAGRYGSESQFKNSCLKLDQSVKNEGNLRFILSQLSFLGMMPKSGSREWTNGLPPATKQTKKTEKSTPAVTYSYYIWTERSAPFTLLRNIWYPKGVKVMPGYIADYLTPKALAIAFLSNGSQSQSGVRYCLYAFSYTDITWFACQLESKYGWNCSICPHRKGFYVYISASSMDSFIATIAPYTVPHAHYKFPVKRYNNWLNSQDADYRQYVAQCVEQHKATAERYAALRAKG